MKHDRWDSSSEDEGDGRSSPPKQKDTEERPKKVAKSTDEKKLVLPKHSPLVSGCRSVYDCYERLDRLDEGAYGVVWKARDTGKDMH